jgi:RNA polymerase sigma-70 factor (ECF subfamily)
MTDAARAYGSRPASLIATLEEGRRQFLELVAEIRPDLHRYCARMTGSVADGEDVVQDTLARAYYQLSELKELPPLRPWLFRIAHNRAIDHYRREAHRHAEPIEDALDVADGAEREPDSALAREQAVRAAMSTFLRLAPAQRGCVILKDVLDHSLEEIAGQLELSVPAVKAALHRGRALLREFADVQLPAAPERAISPALAGYARLFNAHDWDGVRALLASDVRLDLVSRRKAAGRQDVGGYFSNYARTAGWRLAPAWLEGREVLAVLADETLGRPGYFIELSWLAGQVVRIRDFRYVPYVLQEAGMEIVP